MLKFDGKEYRNLQEQVQKNKDDISTLRQGANIAELGITVVNAETPLPSVTDLPDPDTYSGEFGDAYIVGSAAPFELFVFSRSSDPNMKGFWFDWGPLNAPSVIPGPIGPQGIQGEQGIRGSFWYTQSGAPTNTQGVNENDQALDGASGDTYQFVNGAWQITGNIRGPQGIQGTQGLIGPTGPTGPTGPQGPQGEFIQIVGELDNVNQLPMIDTVPRYSAYLIPDAGIQHVWLIIGEGTTANPYVWHDAGGFGGGTNVLINGVQQGEVDVKNVINGAASYEVGDNTTTAVGEGSLSFKFLNLKVTGVNLSGDPVTAEANIELPIASNNYIQVDADNDTMSISPATGFFEDIDMRIAAARPKEVQITAASTSTSGQLTATQLNTLQADKGAYLMFNNEVYRLQDTQNVSGYLVYTHIGFDTQTTYKIKCITVTINTRGWALTERIVPNIRLNGAANQTPSFYAPTAAGTNGSLVIVESNSVKFAAPDKVLATNPGIRFGPDYVKEYYRATDGSEWYRLYESNWLRQGGVVPAATATGGKKTITFPKPFTTLNYTITATPQTSNDTATNVTGCKVLNKTLTSCTIIVSFAASSSSGAATEGFNWTAEGI